jgi:hypothetical protein
VYTLYSWMSELDYAVEPKVECPDNDPNDASFVRATATIGGRDAVEEYVACKMYPLATGFGFESVPLGMTPMSKVESPLLLFAMGAIAARLADQVLAEIEMEVERVVGSFGPREYDTLKMAIILNTGRLNRVLEHMGVSYAPHPLPGSEASQVANKKWKAEVSKKPASRRARAGSGHAPPSKTTPPPPKMGPTKKIGILKISRSKAKPGS